jgi:hypothetical protein
MSTYSCTERFFSDEQAIQNGSRSCRLTEEEYPHACEKSENLGNMCRDKILGLTILDGVYSKEFAAEARKNAKASHDGERVGKVLLRVLGVA